MAGLSDLITNSSTQTTSMPSWYDTAQQNIATQAGTAAAAAPAPGATVAQNAINQLTGPTNAFTTAAGTAQNIATGAANPWITDASGAVTPNTATAMGGLFAAQNQQLKQMIPNITADPDAASIGSGQFGSLRGQTAANRAITDAQANLFAQQNQAALQKQLDQDSLVAYAVRLLQTRPLQTRRPTCLHNRIRQLYKTNRLVYKPQLPRVD